MSGTYHGEGCDEQVLFAPDLHPVFARSVQSKNKCSHRRTTGRFNNIQCKSNTDTVKDTRGTVSVLSPGLGCQGLRITGESATTVTDGVEALCEAFVVT